jgi:hypothetical protein
MQTFTFAPISTRTIDLAVQSAGFASTEWEVVVVSDKARAVCKCIKSFGVKKSELSAFAAEMLAKHDLVVG